MGLRTLTCAHSVPRDEYRLVSFGTLMLETKGDSMVKAFSSGWAGPAVWAALGAWHLGLPFLLSRDHHDIPDEDMYRNLAVNLATEGSFTLDFGLNYYPAGQPFAWSAPGWPWLLSLGYATFQGELGFWLVLGLVWCANTALVWKLAAVLKLPPPQRWALVLWLSFHPFLLFYHGHLMTEALAVGLVLGQVIVGINFVVQPRWRVLLLWAALSGVTSLTRTQALLPSIAVWAVAFFTLPWRRLAVFASVFALVHLAVVAPWLWRMHEVGAGWTSTELKLGLNLFEYSNPNVANSYDPDLQGLKGHPSSDEMVRMSPAERNALFARLALDGIRRRPDWYLMNCLRRVGLLFAPLPVTYESGPLKKIGCFVTTLVFFYAAWGLILARVVQRVSLTRPDWVLLVAVLLWYAFHIAITANVRGRLPSDVLVAALALSLYSRSTVARCRGPGTKGGVPSALHSG